MHSLEILRALAGYGPLIAIKPGKTPKGFEFFIPRPEKPLPGMHV